MSATEELRAMLDERGVEWWEASNHATEWFDGVGNIWNYLCNGAGITNLTLETPWYDLTPAQAIEVTLGRGTCHMAERTEQLQAENEKLRELVDALWTGCPWAERPCQECGHYDGAFCDLYHSMEELGIV